MTERQDDRASRPTPTTLTVGVRRALHITGILLVPLVANSIYLAAVTLWGHLAGLSYENLFYMWMILLHLVLGFGLLIPFGFFVVKHLRGVRERRNPRGRRTGRALLSLCLIVPGTGLLMTLRLLPLESVGGRVSYWAHVLAPVVVVLVYVMHRSWGPRIRWRQGLIFALSVLFFLGAMGALHSLDPREWGRQGGGKEAFLPARVRTHSDDLISQEVLMMDHYCRECHPDAVKDHMESVHHFASFNNPIYLFSIREAREVLLKRDGDVRGTRFCAGCHDPVPLLSGAFDDPNFDLVNDPSAREGVNCTVCHAITDVVDTIGNGNYTIEEPLHYPFTFSDQPFLKWLNHQLIKAKPAFHKKTFLRPLHKSAEFCAVCHKVNIPFELTHYKEWLRGQNHYDNYLLSGVSGHGARSFYYPEKAEVNCNTCHMPQKPSEDFGAREGKIHDHHFPGANTAVPHLKGLREAKELQAAFLRDGQMDLDIFALREDGRIDGTLLGPLRPEIPAIRPGKTYLVEVVLRTLKLGHVFPQGTSDSNEIWIDIEARADGRVIGRSGFLNERQKVDPWAHFVNSLLLDRHGNRIERRNVQDIFTTLYSNMMAPGTGQVVHYSLTVPEDVKGPVEIRASLKYRKFDRTLMEFVYADASQRGEHQGEVPEIPIVVMCQDRVVLPVAGGSGALEQRRPLKPLWQRWRDYGIGHLLAGNRGSQKGDLRQAALAFEKVTALGRPEGWLDLARVHEKEGQLKKAAAAVREALRGGVSTPWTADWLTGRIEAQNGNYELAIAAFDRVLSTRVVERGFDFSLDYEVILEKGRAQFLLARQLSGDERHGALLKSVQTFQRVLELDSENLKAHYNLMLLYRQLKNKEKAQHHRALHERYRPDDNARDQAAAIYRSRNPAANKAAEAIVIYEMNRTDKQ